ncbi:MAG: polar amino acid transport system substrate-binding protein [Enterobacterales bacterium]|jgi:polar amino acid transport system substrate-binding protein
MVFSSLGIVVLTKRINFIACWQRLSRAVWISFFIISPYTYAEDLQFITVDVAPWAYVNKEKNKFLGVFPDLVREIERRTGHHITMTLAPLSLDRINRELQSGRQDCTMIISGKERAEITVLGEKVFDLPMGVVAKKSLPLHTYEDLYSMTISVGKVLMEEGKFMSDKRLNKQLDASYAAGLRKIAHGRLDAVAGAVPTIMHLAKAMGINEIVGKPLVLSVDPIYLQCSKESKNLRYMDEINQAIKSMRLDVTLKKIADDNLWTY